MNYKTNLFFALILVFVVQVSFGQDLSVSGIITDDSKLPLPGVNILVKGTNTSTQTDFDGKYTIKTTEGAVLVFSFLGMKEEEKTVTSSNLSLVMHDDAQILDDVIVTALGIKREKKSLGYAQQDVKGDLLNGSGQLNAVNALSGNVAGVFVNAPSTMGGSTRIVLRGIGSVTGENRPLIVIDGIPLDNGNVNSADTQRGAGGRDYGDATADINPDDIESVTVLKGGPASALYGSRAGNGAILYTTKSGKKGKTEIAFNTGLTFESVYIMPNLQNQYGGGGNNVLPTQTINGKLYNIAQYDTDESWGPKYDPTLMYLPWNAFDPEFPNDYMKEIPWVAPKNDVRSFFNTGITTNNSISFTKSFQEGSNIRFSYANAKTQGIVPNSDLSRNNFSINANAKLNDNLRVESMVNFTQTKAFNRPEIGYGDNSLGQKFFQFGQRQLDMKALQNYKLADGSQRSWNRTAWNDPTPAYSDNPYWTVNENTSEDKRNRTFGNAKITYNFLPELYAVGNVYMDSYSLRINERVAIGSQAQSKYFESMRNVMDINYETRVHYDKTLNDDFTLSSFIGVNRRNRTYNMLSGESVGGLVLPNFFNLTNSAAPALAKNEQERKVVNSVFGFVSLGYKDFAFLELTDRQDWFSTVTKAVNYPSATGSFIFSALLDDVFWLNFGKVRLGWAQAGNDTEPYRTTNYREINPPFLYDPSHSSATSLNNPNLIPELKTTKEIGLEGRILNDRIGFDITYYDAVTKNLITPLEVDPSTGYTSKWINAGKLQNKGIEITLNVNPVRTKDFTWDITWNFAKNNNKLLELYDDVTSLELARAPFNIALLAIVGDSYGQLFGTDFVYDAAGNKVIDATGQYASSEPKALGSIIPDYNMGLRNAFKYKSFTLAILIDRQKGGHYFSTSYMFGNYAGMLENTVANNIRETGIVLDGVLADGTRNTQNISAEDWGRAHYSGPAKQNVFDAGYFKLRDVSLSYLLPKFKNSPFESIQLTVFGRNLLTWGLAWKGMDPEMASYGSGNVQGIEGGSLPSTRTYGINLQVKI